MIIEFIRLIFSWNTEIHFSDIAEGDTMQWPFKEYTLWENLFLLTAFIIPPLVAYFVIKPLLYRFLERRSGPIEKGTDVPDDEYWDE
jgi:hypothetical protein